MHSLGREPQELGDVKFDEPRRGDRFWLQRELQISRNHILSPLRGSGSHDDFSSGFDNRWGVRP